MPLVQLAHQLCQLTCRGICKTNAQFCRRLFWSLPLQRNAFRTQNVSHLAIHNLNNNKCAIVTVLNQSRAMATQDAKTVKSATYEMVKALGTSTDVLIVDVREPSELEGGTIPGSINIPLGEIDSVLKNMPAAEFKAKFGRDKPDVNSALLLSCRSGRRSMAAIDKLQKLGYTNLTNYAGGWLDWEEHLKV